MLAKLSTSPSATNLIGDPGFEDGDLNDNYDSNFVFNNTFSTTFVGLTQPGDNSPNAARLYVSTTGGRTTPAGISQLVVVTPGATYAFSYDLAISIAQPAEDSECDFTVAVDQLVIQTIPLLAVQDYVRYSTSFVAVNSTPNLYLTLTCTGGTGEVEIDNLFLIAT
ncbi:hypothetical protein BJ166DRAFT_515938 [Pestalotiopsis sp. NC0098]|nr:hypothetical protein BJ166DRAFT_515938 [Pestalotiopsis sp. NC0098]